MPGGTQTFSGSEVRIMRFVTISCCLLIVLMSGGAKAQWQLDGMPVCTADDDQWLPQVMADGSGGVFLIWHDYRDGNAGIYAQHLDSAGLPIWTADGVPVCTYASSQWDPRFASDGAGGFIAAWRDNRLDASSAYAQRISATGEKLWADDGVAMSNIFASADYLNVVTDGAGGAIVVWTHEPPATDSDLLAQRVDPDGVLLWGAGGVAVSDYAGDQYENQAIADGAGGVLVCWQDNRGDNDRVFVQRLDASGALHWPSYGVPVSPNTEYQYEPKLCLAATGEAIVAWEDIRGTDEKIYAQHITPNGNQSWGLAGKAICLSSDEQEDPDIVSDGYLGAIIAWKDMRDDSGGDIYAQRIERDGDIVWSSAGVMLNNDPTMVRPPTLCSDNAGGAVASWSFWAGETYWDLAAQRVNGQGQGVWGGQGVVVSAGDRDQNYAQQTADSAGTVIFAWYDSRNGAGNDIYAHRVFADGTILSIDADDATPPRPEITGGGLLLHGAAPNPFNPATRIRYDLDSPALVDLVIFDAAGRVVKVLEKQSPRSGACQAVWRGRGDDGAAMPSGAYYYRLSTETTVRTGKLVLVR
jgi:FlgD Ig-like domain